MILVTRIIVRNFIGNILVRQTWRRFCLAAKCFSNETFCSMVGFFPPESVSILYFPIPAYLLSLPVIKIIFVRRNASSDIADEFLLGDAIFLLRKILSNKDMSDTVINFENGFRSDTITKNVVKGGRDYQLIFGIRVINLINLVFACLMSTLSLLTWLREKYGKIHAVFLQHKWNFDSNASCSKIKLGLMHQLYGSYLTSRSQTFCYWMGLKNNTSKQ